MEIKTGMVFALETYCPAKDGFSAARIEEEIVVTDKGGVVDLAVPRRGAADRERVLRANVPRPRGGLQLSHASRA